MQGAGSDTISTSAPLLPEDKLTASDYKHPATPMLSCPHSSLSQQVLTAVVSDSDYYNFYTGKWLEEVMLKKVKSLMLDECLRHIDDAFQEYVVRLFI